MAERRRTPARKQAAQPETQFNIVPQAPPDGVRSYVNSVEQRMDELTELLDERTERFHEVLALLEIGVVGGYLVKIWPSGDSDAWFAECPTVRCAIQAETPEEARLAIGEAIEDMLSVLSELGHELPKKDVSPGSA